MEPKDIVVSDEEYEALASGLGEYALAFHGFLPILCQYLQGAADEAIISGDAHANLLRAAEQASLLLAKSDGVLEALRPEAEAFLADIDVADSYVYE